jgi:WD40 repeat protein
LATASRDKTAKVFDAHSGELLATYSRHDAQVRGVLFHPSGEKVYSSSVNQKLDLWKYAEAKHERDLNLGGEGFQLFSVGSFFLVPSSGNRVHAIRALEGDLIREFQASEPARFLCATAHEASNLVAAGSQDGKVCVWEFSTGKKRIEFKAIPVHEVASVDKVD